MTRYVLTRAAAIVPVLLLVSMLAFALTSLAAGDPAVEAALQGGGQANSAVVAQFREQMHLDDPLPVRYVTWLGGTLHGDLGYSYSTGRAVGPDLGAVIPNTIILALGGFLCAVSLGLLAGVVAALRHGRLVDKAIRIVISACLAIPGFWLGFLLIFCFGEMLHWLPAGGFGVDSHLVLPALALGIEPAAGIARLVRSSLLDALGRDFTRTAHSIGLRPASVTLRHALPNALLPAISYLGVQCGHLLGGAVVIESVFAWPGVGRLVLAAVSARDLPVIAGYVLFTGLAFTLANLLADMAAAAIDPTVRLA